MIDRNRLPKLQHVIVVGTGVGGFDLGWGRFGARAGRL